MIKRILFSLLLLNIIFSVSAFSQTVETKKNEIEISVCRPKITEMGRQANFHFYYIYKITTGEKGLINEIKEIIDSKKYRSYMDDTDVIPCIKQWKLKAFEKYILRIDVGTTGDEFLLPSNKKETIKVNL